MTFQMPIRSLPWTLINDRKKKSSAALFVLMTDEVAKHRVMEEPNHVNDMLTSMASLNSSSGSASSASSTLPGERSYKHAARPQSEEHAPGTLITIVSLITLCTLQLNP